MTQFGTHTFHYDAFGCRTFKNQIKYTYDDQGRLLKEVNGTHTILYFYDGLSICSIQVDGQSYFLRRNLFQDVTHIYDLNGNLVASYLYDAWGNHQVFDANGIENTNADFIGNINPIRYRGYYFDVETNLFYCNSRYYSSELCRFLIPDSIEYLDPESIHGLNLYCYCKNNPIMLVDPSGHFVISALIIGAVVGVGIGFGGTVLADYVDDGQIFNGSVKWYEYLGAAVLGGIIGAGLGAFASMSFSATLPTGFAMAKTTAGTMTLVSTGSMTLTVTGAQILGVIGLLGTTYMFASNNRPGNNRIQNKQFEQAVRSAGYNPKNPRIKDILNEIHKYIRKNKLNLGWKELLELIKEWLG